MRLYGWEILLIHLAGGFQNLYDDGPHPELKENAYERLKAASGQDFGHDAAAWRRYIEESSGPEKALSGMYKRSQDIDDES